MNFVSYGFDRFGVSIWRWVGNNHFLYLDSPARNIVHDVRYLAYTLKYFSSNACDNMF
jgi:hypothetical protein